MTSTTSFDCEGAGFSEREAVDKKEVSSQKKYGIYCSLGILFGAAVMAGFFVLGPLCKHSMIDPEAVNHSHNHGLGKAFMMPAPWKAERRRLPLAAHAAPLYAETSPFLIRLPARPGVAPRAHVSAMAVSKTDADGNEIVSPRRAYIFFCKERRPSMTAELKASMGPAYKYSDVMAAIGAEWKQLNEAEKAPFVDLEAKDRARYDAAVASNPANSLIKRIYRKRKTKTDADGNEIKGAKTAYMHFCMMRHPTMKAELKASMGPAFKNSDVMTACATEWKQLNEAEKARFVDLAVEDKARYDAAVASNPANSLEELSPSGPKKRNRKKTMFDAYGNEIKAAKTAYSHYLIMRHPTMKAGLKASMGPAFKNADVLAAVGAEWKQLDEADKAPFVDLAAKDRARYDAAVASNPKNALVKRKKQIAG